MGIVIAIFTTLGINIGFGEKLIPGIAKKPATAAILFLILAVIIYKFSIKEDEEVV